MVIWCGGWWWVGRCGMQVGGGTVRNAGNVGTAVEKYVNVDMSLYDNMCY